MYCAHVLERGIHAEVSVFYVHEVCTFSLFVLDLNVFPWGKINTDSELAVFRHWYLHLFS